MRYKRLLSLALAIAILLTAMVFDVPAVNAAETGLPDFNIIKSIDKTLFTEGDTGKITYTVVPTGKAPEVSSANADIVLVMDVSTSMAYGNKIYKATDAAVDFFERMKGTGHKAAFVAFGYKTGYASDLTTDYDALQEEVLEYNRYSNLMDGTNHDDGLKKAINILSKSSAKNKYIVFMTDGMPNYFTSTDTIDKYKNNWYTIVENGIKYYTGWPKHTSEAYSYAVEDAKALSKAGITMFTVGVGKGHQIDLKFLEEISKAGSGKLFKVVDSEAMSKIFEQISAEIDNVNISSIRIKEKLPQGVSLGNNSNAYIDEDGYVVINVPQITFKKNAKIPPEPFAVDLNIGLNKSGKYTLSDSVVLFKDWKGNDGSKAAGSIAIEVNASPGAPKLSVGKAMLNTSATVEENITIQYSIIPEGVYNGTAQDTLKAPVDMVILFDKSSNMRNNYGSGNNRKYVLEKESAISLVNSLKTMNNSSRVAYIEYNRYAKTVKPLTADYQSVIDSINLTDVDTIPAHESGVNYEAALSSAKKLLEGSVNKKMIILLTGSKPDYYTDAYSKHKNYDYYKKNDKDFKNYLDKNRYWFLGYYYDYDKAYSDYYNDKLKGRYDINNGDYSYTDENLPYTEAKAVVSGLADTQLNILAIGKYRQNSSKSDDDYDLEYLRSISSITGGASYEYFEKENLINAVKNPNGNGGADASQYSFKNLVVKEDFPEGVEILADDKINVFNNGRSFTANMQDVVYIKGMGTPERQVLEVRIIFKSEGDYVISGLSKLEYKDNDSSAKALDFNKLNISVASPNYRIDNVTAEKLYTNDVLSGIKVDWNGNLLSNTAAISGFEVMRSINGSDFESIATVNKSVFQYTDTDASVKGRYIYRIDTILNNGKRVEGLLSNEVLLLGKGISNIGEGTTYQKMQINGKDITKVFETYKLNYVLVLEILGVDEGLTSGGIKNPIFEVRLNNDDDSDILYKIKDNKPDSVKLVKVVNGADEVIASNMSYQIIDNNTAKAAVRISYNGILTAGNYKLVFEAIPEKKAESVLPESGKTIYMLMDMDWEDVGLEGVKKSKQLQYNIDIMPLPKLQ